MSLNKAIQHGKEKRKPHRPPAGNCNNHGDCSWCKNGRLHFDRKRRTPKDQELKEFNETEVKED